MGCGAPTTRGTSNGDLRGAASELGTYARSLCRARTRVSGYFGSELFRDPAMSILLDLFASEEEGKVVSSTSCAGVAGVSLTTTLRYIHMLEEENLVSRHPDKSDGRRIIVKLTDRARTAVARMLSDFRALALPQS